MKLEEQEKKVLTALADAYNEFVKLQLTNGPHVDDFVRHIHGAQRVVLSLLAWRTDPDFMARGE